MLLQILAEMAACPLAHEKQAVNPMPALRAGGQMLGKVIPKSWAGRAGAAAATAAGGVVGNDAVQNMSSQHLPKYYDQNGYAAQALGEQAGRLAQGTPITKQVPITGTTPGQSGTLTGTSTVPVSTGELLGKNVPQSDIQAPSILNRIAHPITEARLAMGGDPGAYVPKPTKQTVPIAAPESQLLPTGQRISYSGGTAEQNVPGISNRARQSQWSLQTEDAQRAEVLRRMNQQQQGVMPATEQAIRGQLRSGEQQLTAGQAAIGQQQEDPAFGKARENAAKIMQQSGLEPEALPKQPTNVPIDDQSKNIETLKLLQQGNPLARAPEPKDSLMQSLGMQAAQQVAPPPPPPPPPPAALAALAAPAAPAKPQRDPRAQSRLWSGGY